MRTSRLLVAAAVVLVAFAARAESTTPPRNLGQAGLALDLSLWRFDGSTWAAADASGLDVVDLGDGWYRVEDLPNAAGAEAYQLGLALAGAPERVLAEYAWGAQPGQRIVWRQQVRLQDPRVFKRGDTHGAVSLEVLSGLPADVAGAAATFTLYAPSTGTAVFSGRPASVESVVFDATSGSWGATLVYDLAAGDLAATGRYLGEFTLCYTPGSCHTLPADNTLELRVLGDFDGVP